MPRLYVVCRDWDEESPLLVHSIEVKAVPSGFKFVAGNRSPFRYRSRFQEKDYPTSSREALARFVIKAKQRIVQANRDIRAAEIDLQDVRKLK